jgi:hypothetical protein
MRIDRLRFLRSHEEAGKGGGIYTRSSVFFAFSETKGSAMGGIRSDAGILNDENF